MHKTAGFTVTAATLTTMVVLPQFAIAPITLIAIITATTMVLWAVIYLQVQSRRKSRV